MPPSDEEQSASAPLLYYYAANPRHQQDKVPIRLNHALVRQMASGDRFNLRVVANGEPYTVKVMATSPYHGLRRFTGDIASGDGSMQHIGQMSMTISADGGVVIGNVFLDSVNYEFQSRAGARTA